MDGTVWAARVATPIFCDSLVLLMAIIESNTSSTLVPNTPSTHRQRLNLGANVGLGLSTVNGGLHQGTPGIPPISPGRGPSRIGGQPNNGFAGYGMSAGLKVSHTPTQGQRLPARAASGPRGMSSYLRNRP